MNLSTAMRPVAHANGVITYTWTRFASLPVQAHVTTRHGGVSPPPWNTLNFSVRRGDAPDRVQENLRRLCAALALQPEDLVRTQQVHGTRIAQVTWADAGSLQEDADGLVTDAVGLPLFLVFADCVPVVLYDPAHHVLAACHAGWRGTVDGIAAAALEAMVAVYDTDPAQVWAGIGPSIGPESYPVGPEVVELARARLHRAERFLHRNGREQVHFDLWEANAAQLVEAGVPRAQIEIAGIDTAQNTQDFFSHRAEQGRCGLFALVAWLQPRPGSRDSGDPPPA